MAFLRLSFAKKSFLCSKNQALAKSLHIAACLILLLLLTRCAQITPLTGGKKDAEPPKLVDATPKNASLNFAGKTITLEFNEYVVLKDVSNQLIITPQMNAVPDVEASGKIVTIRFNEDLQPNTTYKMAFGNSITDLRENNPYTNFEYIFSTGSTIDSLTIHGQAITAIDNKAAANVLVSLYDGQANDSIVFHDKPLFISRTDEKGNFLFDYLPNKSFKMVAVKDNNRNLMYDGSEEMIGFSQDLLRPDTSLHTLKLFREVPGRTYIKKASSPEYGRALIAFNRPYMQIESVAYAGAVSYNISPARDTINLFYKNIYDTATVYIAYHNRKTDTVTIKIPGKESYQKMVQKNNIRYSINANVVISPFDYFSQPVISLNYPCNNDQVDASKIRLIETKDSVTASLPFKLTGDKQGMNYTLDTKLSPGAAYQLVIQRGAFSDGESRRNDSTSYKFKTTLPEDYAQLTVRLFFPKKENYLVQLLNDKEQVVRTEEIELSLTTTAEQKIDFKNLAPGNYFIKVIEDTNKNGRFDEGDYLMHVQPEIIYYNINPVKLLADWEIENEWKVQ